MYLHYLGGYFLSHRIMLSPKFSHVKDSNDLKRNFSTCLPLFGMKFKSLAHDASVENRGIWKAVVCCACSIRNVRSVIEKYKNVSKCLFYIATQRENYVRLRLRSLIEHVYELVYYLPLRLIVTAHVPIKRSV